MLKKKELKYPLNAFEGIISEEIMNLHYNKHYNAYTENFNKIIQQENIEYTSLEKLFSDTKKLSSGLINNGGGYFNHTFFWNCITENNQKRQMSDRLIKKIEESFGSFNDFKIEFKKQALGLFGSGWLNLVLDKNNKLKLIQTQNQDSVIMDFIEKTHGKTKLILNLDLWEHAYYLDYKNVRADYIDNFFKIINWDFVEKNIFD